MKKLKRAYRSTLAVAIAAALSITTLDAAPKEAGLWTALETRLRFDSLENAGMGNINLDFLRDNANDENRYLYLRSTLELGYRIPDGGEALVQFRDNRAHDYDAPNKGLDRPVDLYQAWYKFPASRNVPVSTKLGRQEFDFGSKILVGTPNYKKGRSYDALRFDYKSAAGTITAFSGRLVTQEAKAFNDSSESRNTLSGLNFRSNKLLDKLDSQLYYFNKSSANSAATQWSDIHSVGTLIATSKDPKARWSGGAEAVYQFGSAYSGGIKRDHRAYLVSVFSKRHFREASWRPVLTLEAYYSPGDKDPDDLKVETFDLVYSGKNHPRGGVGDITGWRNSKMLHIGLAGSPKFAKNLAFSLDHWAYWMADTRDLFYAQGKATGRTQNGYGRNPGFSSYIGQATSLTVLSKLGERSKLKLEFSRFNAGDYIEQSLENAGGHKDANRLSIEILHKL